MIGSWVEDTYTWSEINFGANSVGITITLGPGAILVDTVQMYFVPEPGSVALLAGGLLAFRAHRRFRRQNGN